MTTDPKRVIYKVKGTPFNGEVQEFPLYNVYLDGTFHYLDPKTGNPAKEPEEIVQERTKALEGLREETSMIGSGGIAKFNRASHEEYQTAFKTLCRLGYGPGSALNPGWERYGADVEYFGEDEPWIDVYEYDRRNGIEGVTYE